MPIYIVKPFPIVHIHLKNEKDKKERRLITVTNKNDNRERKNKYPRNKEFNEEFAKDATIRSEITQKDIKKN